MLQNELTILENKEIAPDIYRMELDGAGIDEEVDFIPGQFFYIRISDTSDPLLRRPISIHDYDKYTKRIKLIYRKEGKGTELLKNKKTGEKLDVLGPVGNGYSLDNLQQFGNVVLIGGGIGIPPLYYLAKKLVEKGQNITVLLGYESSNTSFLTKEFKKFGDVRIASLDGSLGIKGNVLDLVKSEDDWDAFYTCGPTGMMKAIKNKWQASAIEGYVSLEERMGCGIGACYGCTVKVDQEIDEKGYKKVCSDGPVFNFREVLL